MSIEISQVSKRFGNFLALDNVSLQIPEGKLTALLGPSGSGKTTLLRIIAGLEEPDTGEIRLGGQSTAGVHVSHRGVGFVFQHYALFRHMTVFDNVAFGLSVKSRQERPSKGEIRDRVNELLRLVQLEGLAERYPSQLSGGQRQRVALARALAVKPRVMLLDEPFGALDAKVRAELRRWLRQLHEELNVTSVFVTHDQEEALEVADQVVVMNKGRIEQAASPQEVWDKPANPFVYNFLGNVNLFHGRVHAGQAMVENVRLCLPEMRFDDESKKVVAFVRPYDIDVSRQPFSPDDIHAEVRFVHAAGALIRVELARVDSGEPLEAQMDRERLRDLALAAGDRVWLRPKNMQVFVDDYQI